MDKDHKDWFVYMAQGRTGRLYTGISTDPERRIKEHNESKKGAKWARMERPLILVYSCHAESKSDALKKEIELKRLSRKDKLLFIGSENEKNHIT